MSLLSLTEFQTLLLLGGMVTFFAATVAGMTGFGYGLVSVPLLMVVLPPRVVVPAVTTHILLLSLLILLEVIKKVDVRRIWPLMLTGLFGLPLGIYVLLALSESALRAITGVVIVLFALALLLGLNLEIKNEKLALAPVGIASGLLASGIAMAGPPVILFFSNQGMLKQVFRANLAAYFVFLNTLTIPAHAASGLITGEVVRFALLFLPTLVAGMVLGSFLSRRVPEVHFRRVVLVVVLCSGLLSITSGLGIF
ncbi:MAG: sulfite exporter TauE/SafE family protein [Chloroflexi bacterium]|nr:sulfite exporter TauE/SafE family protein [Chloroflexota bacterium]